DHGWVEAGSRRAAYYAYLPPGSYTFVVSAANSDGVWNTEPQRLSIIVLPPFWRTWWFILMSIAAIAASIILVYRRRISALKKAQAAQQEFSRQLIDSQESERKRIAAELHDSLGQNLLVIKNWAVLGLGTLKDKDPAQIELSEISSAASQAINEVREISYNLRPHLLDEVGLTEALKAMTKRIAAASGIKFSIDIDPIDRVFSKDAEINVYRIVQEALNNIVRHSKAAEATVAIRQDQGEIVVEIIDNGVGFASGPELDGRKGFGLVGMSERARMLGGKLTAAATPSSASGHGARLEVRLPVQTDEK
ncbi:MAG: ATP-binding protein, partial [Blastocatellia bacterium]